MDPNTTLEEAQLIQEERRRVSPLQISPAEAHNRIQSRKTSKEADDAIQDPDFQRMRRMAESCATLPLINPWIIAYAKATIGLAWFLGTLLAIGHTLWELAQ